MQTAEHRLGDDPLAIADAMAAARWRTPIGVRTGDARPETGVRPSPIVVSHLLAKHAPHVALVQQNHEIKTLTPDRADHVRANG